MTVASALEGVGFFTHIQRVISEGLWIPEDTITPSTRFRDDLRLKKRDKENLFWILQKDLAVSSISVEKLAEIQTVGDLVHFVLERKQHYDNGVLIIDDDREEGWKIKDPFEGVMGHPCLISPDWKEALLLLIETGGPIVFLDVELKGSMSGLKLLERIREVARTRRVVLMTDGLSPQDRTRALELGADGIIERPVNWDKVFDVLIASGLLLPRDLWEKLQGV